MATRSLSKNDDLHILDLIDQYAPRQHRTTGNPRSRYTLKCPICEHESSTGLTPISPSPMTSNYSIVLYVVKKGTHSSSSSG